MNERPAAPAEPATSNDIPPGTANPTELTDQELLRITAQAQIYRFQATAGDPVQYEPTEAQLLAAFRAAIAADRAGHSTPARLRHCPTHGHQPPEAWGCPECVRELRKELKALRAAIAAERASRPAPVEPADDGPSIEQLGPLISWLTEQCDQAANAGRSTDAGMLLWAAQVAGERVDEDALDTPTAEGEAAELAAALQLRAAQNPLGFADPVITRAVALLQQLATLRQERPHG